ncbi:MAG TPA: thioesterase family protein [Candidatus Eisenbacteria bacterium]|jgi:acyl-CoA thioesterase FadM|nr:thioesterase family protein [Candidatus Eisenbacteria bacterium]
MSLLLRVLGVFLGARRRGRLDVRGESVLRLRVWPNDLDIYGHLNNGRYLTLMDLGRFDLILRTGMGRLVKRNRWTPLVASATIRYRKPLKAFQPFELKTRIVCWDEKWVFIDQRFETDGVVAAAGLIRGLFRGPLGSVPTAEVLAGLGTSVASPPWPDGVKLWFESEAASRLSGGSS